MFGADFLELGFFFAQIIAIVFGLWTALTLERVVSLRLIGEERSSSRSVRIYRALAWLGLGYLLALPFLQLFQMLHSLLRASLPQYAVTNMMGIAWGMAPFWLWTVLNAIGMLAVYTIFISVASPRLKSKIVSLDPTQISERIALLIIFSGASIAWNAVNMLVSLVLMPEIPALQLTGPDRGIIGFLGGWLIAVLIVLTIAFYHNSRQSDLPSVGSVQ